MSFAGSASFPCFDVPAYGLAHDLGCAHLVELGQGSHLGPEGILDADRAGRVLGARLVRHQYVFGQFGV